MPIDIANPQVSKDAEGSPVITLKSTKDGKPHVTNVTTYHGMSDEHLAALGAAVDKFFAQTKHTGLSDREFDKWEDAAYKAISGFREKRKGKK